MKKNIVKIGLLMGMFLSFNSFDLFTRNAQEKMEDDIEQKDSEKKRKTLLIAGVGTGAVTFGVVGYFVWEKYSKKKEQQEGLPKKKREFNAPELFKGKNNRNSNDMFFENNHDLSDKNENGWDLNNNQRQSNGNNNGNREHIDKIGLFGDDY